MFEPKKILVPTDFSDSSDRALQEAIDVAGKYHSKVTVLHVIDKEVPQCAADYCLPSDVVERMAKESDTASRERMQAEIGRLSGAQAVQIDFDVKHGVPSDEILKEQTEKGIDLIVMASHGRTGLARLMLGSVADKVVKRATAPVLLVRG